MTNEISVKKPGGSGWWSGSVPVNDRMWHVWNAYTFVWLQHLPHEGTQTAKVGVSADSLHSHSYRPTIMLLITLWQFFSFMQFHQCTQSKSILSFPPKGLHYLQCSESWSKNVVWQAASNSTVVKRAENTEMKILSFIFNCLSSVEQKIYFYLIYLCLFVHTMKVRRV